MYYNKDEPLKLYEDYELDNMYDEWLDLQGPVNVAGLTFYPSRILSECDPIAYRCGFDDFLNSCEFYETRFDSIDDMLEDEHIKNIFDVWKEENEDPDKNMEEWLEENWEEIMDI